MLQKRKKKQHKRVHSHFANFTTSEVPASSTSYMYFGIRVEDLRNCKDDEFGPTLPSINTEKIGSDNGKVMKRELINSEKGRRQSIDLITLENPLY